MLQAHFHHRDAPERLREALENPSDGSQSQLGRRTLAPEILHHALTDECLHVEGGPRQQ